MFIGPHCSFASSMALSLFPALLARSERWRSSTGTPREATSDRVSVFSIIMTQIGLFLSQLAVAAWKR